jgi:hypothetical protein
MGKRRGETADFQRMREKGFKQGADNQWYDHHAAWEFFEYSFDSHISLYAVISKKGASSPL